MLNFVILLVALAGATPADDVKTVLTTQVEAWNRGDLEAFVTTYSAESVFVGKEVTRGNRDVLARYRRSYPTKGRMGALTFTDLEVKLLGSDYASVIGRFHLARADADGGNATGIFTLLLRKTSQGWKIILDHTS